MASVSIRDLDDEVRDRLRVQAAAHGRSMEAEMRAILTDAVRAPEGRRDLFVSLLDVMAPLGGVELEVPERSHPPRRARLVR